MQTTYTVRNRLGFHVMPSKRLAQIAESYACEIHIELRGNTANPKKMIEVLKLGIKPII